MGDAVESTKIWYLRRMDLFASMTDEEIEQMAMLLNDHLIPADVDLLEHRARETVLLVKTGAVRLYARQSRPRVTVAILGPGRLLGLSPAVGDDSATIGAMTLAPSYICFATWPRLVEVLLGHPSVMLKVTQAMAEQVFRAETWQERLGKRDPGARLADLLLELSDEFGEESGTARRIPFRVTQADLARMIGLSRETVSRTMAQFDQTGAIARERGRIVIRDRGALAAVAAGTGEWPEQRPSR